MSIGTKTSSLLFGIQWDLVLKYIESKGEYTKDGTRILINESLIKSDSTNWGNYSNSTFAITNVNAKYSEDSGATYNFIPSKGYSKINRNILLTTGTTERNSVSGIYDLAGNVREFTLEKTTNASNLCSNRGGYYGNTGINIPASARNYTNILGNYDSGGFRTALY